MPFRRSANILSKRVENLCEIGAVDFQVLWALFVCGFDERQALAINDEVAVALRFLRWWGGVFADGRGTAAEISFAANVENQFCARRCFSCHGPTAENGGLRLHKRETAFAEVESGGRAIMTRNVPGKFVLARWPRSTKPRPCRRKAKPLTPEEIEILRKWIAQGEQNRNRTDLCATQTPERLRHGEIRRLGAKPDRRVCADRLDAAGLHPNPAADKRTLAQRTYFDIIGLPPTIEQLAKFGADESPRLGIACVDELLARSTIATSARHRLDLVRYAETNGYSATA